MAERPDTRREAVERYITEIAALQARFAHLCLFCDGRGIVRAGLDRFEYCDCRLGADRRREQEA